MAQVNKQQRLTGSFHTRVAYSSLNDMIKSVYAEDKPMTLRQVSNRGFFDTNTVTAALRENTQSGALATFKIGPINYYASPYAALTSKGPTFTNFVSEIVKNALWKGRHRVNALTEKIFDLAGG